MLWNIGGTGRYKDTFILQGIRALTLSIVLIVTPNHARKPAVFRRHVRVLSEKNAICRSIVES